MRWIVRTGVAELSVRRSRFVARALFLPDPPRWESALAAVRETVPGASHYVYAWRWDPGHEGADDAGEPAGTGGHPILDLLRRRELERAMVVVARYFGGIKLGRPGLLRAYREAAAAALDAAPTAEAERVLPLAVGMAYALYHAWLAELEQGGCRRDQVDFGPTVTWRGVVRARDLDRLEAWAAAQGGAVDLRAGLPEWGVLAAPETGAPPS